MSRPPLESIDSIERRKFLKGLGLGGGVLVAGCTGEQDGEGGTGEGGTGEGGTGDEGGADTEAPSGDGKQGGELIVTRMGGPSTLNPILHTTSPGYFATQWMYSNLTHIVPGDEGLELVPDLATDWEANDNADQWTFMLRDDAFFNHNDQRVIAEDVKATFDTIYQPDQEYPGLGGSGPIDTVEIVDDQTVQLNLERPDGKQHWKVGSHWGRILPKDVLDSEGVEAFNTDDYGSGPFRLDNFEKGNEVSFSRYEDYYKTDEDGNELPFLDGVTLRIIPETSTEVQSLANGNSDLMEIVRPADWDRVQNNSDIETYQVSGGWHFPVTMRRDMEPFSDRNLVDAVKYAADKEELLEVAAQGYGTIAQNHPVSPAHDEYVELDDPFGDKPKLDEAREAMEAAGYGDGFDYTAEYGPLAVPAEYEENTGQIAVTLKEQLAEIDFTFEVQMQSWDQWVSNSLENEFNVNSWPMSITAGAMMHLTGHSEGGFYHGFMADEDEFDSLLEDAMATLDPDARQEAFEEAMKYYQMEGGCLIPFFTDRLGASRTWVEGYKLDPTGYYLSMEGVSVTGDSPRK